MYYITRVTKCSMFFSTEGDNETTINLGYSDNDINEGPFAYMFYVFICIDVLI